MPVVKRVGRGEQTFVFFGGSPGDHRVWDHVVERAPEGAELLLVDFPDHGDAPDAPDASLSAFEDDAVEVLSVAGAGATVVGLSMGAYVAARVLPRTPQIGRAVLIAGFAEFPEEVAASRSMLADQIDQGALPLADFVAVALDLWLPPEERDAKSEAMVRAMVGAMWPERASRSVRRMSGLAAPEQAVGRFDTPALVVHARGDQAVPYALGVQLAARGTAAELVSLDCSSHLLPLTHPERIADLLFQ